MRTEATKRAMRLATAGAASALLLATSGCGAGGGGRYAFEPGAPTVRPARPEAPRGLVMLDRDGRAISWSELMDAVGWAEVVVLGETHDDATAHAVQAAIVEDAADLPGTTAVSLEMLERPDQASVDRYLAGETDAASFAGATGSTNWAGEGTWARFYQPVVDRAREAGMPVIAANAPREVVRRASREGYDALAALPEPERASFELPVADYRGHAYRARFEEIMAGMGGAHGGGGADGGAHAGPSVEEIFRSQLVWDATMADSIVGALDAGADRVIHLVGQFHSDHEGGTIAEIRARRPGTRILSVSLVPRGGIRLAREDVGRADVVVLTGAGD